MVDFLIAVPLRHILQVSSSPLHNVSHAYASSARSGMAASLFLMLLLTGSYHQLDILTKQFLILTNQLKINVCHFKTKIIKNVFPTTSSEKYISGKQCPKLQEFVVWLG
jgi:hypothetical protein